MKVHRSNAQGCMQNVMTAFGHFIRYLHEIDEGITPVNPNRISR